MLREQADRYIKALDGTRAPSTMAELPRRYNRIIKDLERLHGRGLIRNLDFSTITHEEIKEYAVMIRRRNLSPKTVNHHLGYLSSICAYYGNLAVKRAKAVYPILFYRPKAQRMPPLSKAKYAQLAGVLAVPETSFKLARAKASVALALGAGLRPIEIQHLPPSALDFKDGTVHVDVTKGYGTYAHSRQAPILDPFVGAIHHYYLLRLLQPATVAQSRFLFPNPATGDPLHTNTLRVDKGLVEGMAGFAFDYRILRRTYAQLLFNSRIPAEAVSVVIGHSSVKTTHDAYGRMLNETAIEVVREGLAERGINP